MAHTFFGGVFPATRKESTRRKPLAQLSQPPREVAIPLLMCSDGPSVPVVRPGDPVSVGQVIARRGDCGVAIHASVSGRVRAIEPRPHPWGGKWDAIVIDNDGQDTPCPDLPEPMDWSRMDRKEVLERIRQKLHFTSLRYHRLDDLIESVGIDRCKLCTYCWDGKE